MPASVIILRILGTTLGIFGVVASLALMVGSESETDLRASLLVLVSVMVSTAMLFGLAVLVERAHWTYEAVEELRKDLVAIRQAMETLAERMPLPRARFGPEIGKPRSNK